MAWILQMVKWKGRRNDKSLAPHCHVAGHQNRHAKLFTIEKPQLKIKLYNTTSSDLWLNGILINSYSTGNLFCIGIMCTPKQ
jgi:hypothetical protein